MVSRTKDEARERYIDRMGEALGTQFHALWEEVVWLHWNWAEHVELFGSKPAHVELFNEAAPLFFRLVQDALWEVTALHIARLTDPPISGGKANLTIRNLPAFVNDAGTRQAVVVLIEEAIGKASFCRDWRNRHIAHRDLDLALERAATPLPLATRKQVKEALAAIAKVLDYLDVQYMDSTTYWEGGHRVGDARSLLDVLHDGLKAARAREARLQRGEFGEEAR